MKITARTTLCIIIGDPVEHSLSPAMHNAAYAALGLDFVFVAAHVRPQDLSAALHGARVMGVRGITITIPHKVAVMGLLDSIDETAQKIGAVNTVVNKGGMLAGYNTDWLGTLTPLRERTELKGKRVGLLGSGGAARAMAYAVAHAGAELQVYVRSKRSGEEFAGDFGARVYSFEEVSRVADCDIILNATPLGMGEAQDQSPVPAKYLQKGQIVFDAVYTPRHTRLLNDAAAAGAIPIFGTEMLLHQGTAQFTLYTGIDAPVDVMRYTLETTA